MTNKKPCYGTIPYLGKGYSVSFDVSEDILGVVSSNLEGYGDFPFDRYPNIPVIDFRSCNTDQLVAAINLPRTVRPSCTSPNYHTGTLETYLSALNEIGVKVIH